MNDQFGFIFGRAKRKKRGFILVPTLVLLMLASLMLVPLLNNMGTGLKVSTMYTDKSNALYSSDAGIEDAFWQIKYDHLTSLNSPSAYDEFDYNTQWAYQLPAQPNQNTTNVTIENVWVPSTISAPTSASAKTVINEGRLIVTGGGAGPGAYHIKVTYYPAPGENLKIDKIGIWLPPGVTYKPSSSNLEADNTKPYYSVPVRTSNQGGQDVVWSFSPSLAFTSFPGVLPTDSPMTTEVDFNYLPSTAVATSAAPAGSATLNVTSTAGFASTGSLSLPGEASPVIYAGTTATSFTGIPTSGSGALTVAHPIGQAVSLAATPDAVSWINTSNVADLTYSWDSDVNVYRVTSTADSTQVESYFAKSQVRKLGGAIAGDYRAAGNSLMIMGAGHQPPGNSQGIRYTLLSSSSTAVSDIPADAQVAAAYLYWTGWRDDSNKITGFNDPCSSSNLTNFWTNGGDWSFYSSDTTYRANHTGSDTRRPLTLKNNLNLSSYAPGTAYIVWDQYDTPAPAVNVIPLNPDTCSNFNNWFNGNSWTISSNKFKGKYVSPGRDLLLKNALDLSAYGLTGRITISWSQAIVNGPITSSDGVDLLYSRDGGATWVTRQAFRGGDGNPPASFSYAIADGPLPASFLIKISLVGFTGSSYCTLDNINLNVAPSYSAADGVDLALSSDGGTTWSNNVQVFRGDIGTSPLKYTFAIPNQYLTNSFKFRLYLQGFDAAGQYYDVNNIMVQSLPADNGALFKIGAKQVYFDASGNPAQGAQDVTSSKTQVLYNWDYGIDQHGYTYSSYRDVTALVLAYGTKAADPATNRPGNDTYTVGNVTADTGDNWSFADWSLILIYTSPDTEGHQLFLYDKFQYADHNTDIDFDNDGQPGGSLSGFIVPPQIAGDVNVAKMTFFVGEGDWAWSGDFLAFNAPVYYRGSLDLGDPNSPWEIPDQYKLWDGVTLPPSAADPNLPNNATQPDNVWNSYTGGVQDGIDIKTFNVTWASGMMHAGDTTARIDVPTQVDVLNFIYIILSFRSEATTGGSLTYLIHG